MTTYTIFDKIDETKVMRDPVHRYIYVEYRIIWDLINAPEFQRLRRIHQLGATYQVYHTAEHSRFSHSLGVYELVRLIVERVKDLRSHLTEFEYVAILCAGLLHDIGHGPLSHAFEEITSVNHEVFTDRIILEDTKIHAVLERAHPDLPQTVADIIAHRHPRKLLTQIISSQLDADRMDYLLRDSYFTGVSYGEFDLHRILRTMRVADDQLVVKESGIHAIEDYIMARYQMYWQVYLHPTSRSFEAILQALFRRMRALKEENTSSLDEIAVFLPFVSDEPITLQAHYCLDESVCFAGFMRLQQSSDPILKDLSRRLLDRDLFRYVDIHDDKQETVIRKRVTEAGYDARYYVMTDFTTQALYVPYTEDVDERIWVKTDAGLVELSSASAIVKGFVTGEDKQDRKIFFPKEIRYESGNTYKNS